MGRYLITDTLSYTTNSSYFYNIGSVAALITVLQVMSGFILLSDWSNAFYNVSLLTTDSMYGYLIRMTHAIGVNMLFVVVYVHILRSLFASATHVLSIRLLISGIIIYMLLIGIAFTGYVLIYAQMSYWALTVICSIVNVLPIVGDSILVLLWGNTFCSDRTLFRFMEIHYLLPLAMLALIMVHLLLLHTDLATNTTTMYFNDAHADRLVQLHMYRDFLLFTIVLICSAFIISTTTFLFGGDNYLQHNTLVTPDHILPEWYFLLLYGCLRCIPNMSLGMLYMVAMILLLPISATYTAHVRSLYVMRTDSLLASFLLVLAAVYPAVIPAIVFVLFC